MEEPLRGPVRVVVPTGLSVSDASAVLRRMVGERKSIEVATGVASDRRVTGSVAGARADLSIRDARLLTRRKSWNIEFLGTLKSTADGATLTGTIDIPDRRQLHAILWMFRIAAGLAAFFWIALALRDLEPGASIPVVSIVGAIVGVVALGWVMAKMEDQGQRAAAEDAHLLVELLHRSPGRTDLGLGVRPSGNIGARCATIAWLYRRDCRG